MIEEQGRVVAREPGAIWVETVRAGTCSSCQARQGCGHSVINRQAAGQRARLRVVTDLNFRDGDPVVIGVPEKAVLYGALWVYALPLALLFGGALLGDTLSLTLAGRAVDGAALFGVGGLLLGFLITRLHGRRVAGAGRYQPRVLSRPGAAVDAETTIRVRPAR